MNTSINTSSNFHYVLCKPNHIHFLQAIGVAVLAVRGAPWIPTITDCITKHPHPPWIKTLHSH